MNEGFGSIKELKILGRQKYFASGVVTIFTECIFPKHYYDFDGSNFGYDLFSIRREKLEYSILTEFGTSEMRACVK